MKTQAFLVLSLHSIHKTAEAEAEAAGRAVRPSQVLKAYFKNLLKQRHLVYTAIVLSSLALGLWIVHDIPYAWHGSLVFLTQPISQVLIYTLIIFFGLETVYRMTQRWWPQALRNSRRFDTVALAALFMWALLASFASSTACAYFNDCTLLDTLFWSMFVGFLAIFFIGGIGGIGVIRTLSDSIASRIEITRRWQFAFLFAAVIGLYFGLQVAGGSYLGAEIQAAYVGIFVALVVGFVYFVYLARKKEELYRSENLVYITIFLALAGLFIGYSLHNLTVESLSLGGLSLQGLNVSVLSSVDYAKVFMVPLVLIAVGYVDLLITVPGTVEKKVRVQEERIAPSLTFFMLFVVVGAYESSVLTWDQAGVKAFSYLGNQASFYGLVFGALIGGPLLIIAKRRRLDLTQIRRRIHHREFCSGCHSRLESSARFCGACGKPILHDKHKFSSVSSGKDASSQARTPEGGELFRGEGAVVIKRTQVHSAKRKIASLVAGGPAGYLFFGRDETRKSKAEGPLVVTKTSINCAGNDYPIDQVLKATKRPRSPLVTLALGEDYGSVGPDRMIGPGPGGTRVEALLRARDADALFSAIEEARGNETILLGKH